MAKTLRIELLITVNSDEQAALIFEAAANGIAELAIKERVLYGTQASPVASVQPQVDPAVKQKEATTKLVSHAKGAPKVTVKESTEEPKERVRGIMGRSRMTRSGGGGK